LAALEQRVRQLEQRLNVQNPAQTK
jgi:BMFP domain-containing protein YqiC